ncbi:MAG: hypothetical protein JST01_01065 [Cyanobacteria bacterium SZAS TMP-1]|nr:hypothetical protein [Cyanobacteria bacterium SZAS TMP-1]
MKRSRRPRGSVIAFSTVLALVLVLLGLGFLFISLYSGAQLEVKNATDAGALNVGKQLVDHIAVTLDSVENQLCFADCSCDSTNHNSPTDNRINLHRINRVWAKAMLIAINADAANNDGNAGSGGSHATEAIQGAQTISDALAVKLSNPAHIHGYFSELATQNSVRMIGTDSATNVLVGDGWQSSLMDREVESNIALAGGPDENFYMPPGYNLPAGYSTKCTRNPIPDGAEKLHFLKGYQPLTIAGKTFWQVPFKYAEKPHLVSNTKFDAEKVNVEPIAWEHPLPNAYSVEGQALKAGAGGEKAKSWVLSNPRQPFKLAEPHSFVHIKLDQMKCHWYFYPFPPGAVEFGDAQDYDYNNDDKTGTPMPQGGVLCALVTPPSQTIGKDVSGRTLDEVIFGLPKGDEPKVEGYMVNRANEMISKPGVDITADALHKVLGNELTINWLKDGERDFYLFSADGETLVVLPKSKAQDLAATWMPSIINHDPDGSESKLIADANMPGSSSKTHVPTPDPDCEPTPGQNVSWVRWDKDVYWKPGTGYNGSLGEIRVKRWSEVHTVGVCNPS